MPESEFSIIDHYFRRSGAERPDVALGIGDDAALLRVPEGQELVVTVDTLVAGVHFPVDTPPVAIGHKALAVNLSDLAAMGATPAWITLALTLPTADNDWLDTFAEGLFALATTHDVQLVGGDTTHGPLSVTVQAMGLVPEGRALRRSGAREGDAILVTGYLGDAALALQQGAAASTELRARLDTPQPRVAAGQALRELASSAIDISDGLLADLGHIVRASAVGAELWMDALPRSVVFRHALGREQPDWYGLPLTGGDDYELCVTLPPERVETARARLAELGLPLTEVGRIRAGQGIRCHHEDGREYQPTSRGYEHFST
ncbi:MAG TPA: thiamine-phosphate kinase [Gammaproteobacteria bacterium]|nr:thiamine-phosphate kinase [Gammaproteobacteria bacterium]